MSGMVECCEHGAVRPAFVCRHLVETLRDGVARGLLWSRDEDGNINAYCDLCDGVLEQAGGDWTDEIEDQVKVTMICEACFRAIEKVNGGGS